MTEEHSLIRHPIEWAMDTDIDPVFTLANWLVQDALDTNATAIQVVTSKETELDDFRILKRLFKQLRTQGELPADRRLGARLYAASIAGALVFHERLITTGGDCSRPSASSQWTGTCPMLWWNWRSGHRRICRTDDSRLQEPISSKRPPAGESSSTHSIRPLPKMVPVAKAASMSAA